MVWGGGVAVRARAAMAPRARFWSRGSSAPGVTRGAGPREVSVSGVSLGARRRAQAPARLAAPEGRLVEIQRSRLLAGAVAALEELGYAQTTVTQITSRARVSRRTFYELFENCEERLAALLDDILGMLERELAEAGSRACRGVSGCVAALRWSWGSLIVSLRWRGCV